MDLSDLIESGRVRITCSKCGTRFKGNVAKCPKCGTPWQVGDAISPAKKQPPLKKGVDPAKRTAGGEVREI